MDELLTVKQAAIILKVHHLTVRRYINEGKLKAIRAAGNVRITNADLRTFQEGYIPNQKQSKNVSNANASSPTTTFAANDALFRMRGRGVSLDDVK
jgi:excisionase family DNA binding protein